MILVKNLQKDGKFPTSIRELGFKKFRTSEGQRESRGNVVLGKHSSLLSILYTCRHGMVYT